MMVPLQFQFSCIYAYLHEQYQEFYFPIQWQTKLNIEHTKKYFPPVGVRQLMQLQDGAQEISST